jgi:hypothetical protein
MKRTADLDRYDRLVERIRERASEARRHYTRIHELRMLLDRATPSETTVLASTVANEATYLHEESLLANLVGPFLAPSQKGGVSRVLDRTAKAETARTKLFGGGLGPILKRAYHRGQEYREERPQVPPSLYERVGQGAGIRLSRGELATIDATEGERAGFYRELLEYEKAIQAKEEAISALEMATAVSVLGEGSAGRHSNIE